MQNPLVSLTSMRWLFLLAFLTPWMVQAALPDFTEIVDEAKDSVVNISTTKSVSRKPLNIPDMPELPEGTPFGDLLRKFLDPEQHGGKPREFDSHSLGSGFIISSDGYIMTNHHVIDGADEVIVKLNNRKEYDAKVIGSDPDSDIALLKIDADRLPAVKIGDSSKLKVGEWVLAIGSPFGFDHSVTAGIVSAKGRSLPSENYVPFIQTDVAINPGNSGGPLFNMDGEVVGINSQIYSRSGGFMGLSFSIPIEMAIDVSNQIKDTGSVSRGWLGVLIQEVNRDLADSFGMKDAAGALVARVVPDSPAAKAGIQVGDVILEFNGKEITHSSSLPPLVGRSPVGENAKVKVLRDGKTKVIKVLIAQLPDGDERASLSTGSESMPEEKTLLGLVVKEATAEKLDSLGVDSGVLVAEVKSDEASQAGLRDGDVIIRLNNKAVKSLDDFNSIAGAIKPGTSVAVLVQRANGPVFLALKVAGE